MARAEARDPEFDGWLSELEIQPNPKMRSARWRSFQTLAAQASTAQMECWVRLAFEMERLKPDEQEREKFAQAFKKNDPAFDPKRGRQLQILAGVGLALRLKDDGERANEAALAILGASVYGARSEIGSLHLVERATENLEREVHLRGGDIAVASSLASLPADFGLAPALAKLSEAADTPAVAVVVRSIANVIQSHLVKLHSASLKAAEAADRALARQDQELGMHWWLTGGRSTYLKAPFLAVDDKIRPLVLANELSDLTKDHVGPASIDALLVRAGVNATRETTIPTVVCACDADILGWVMSGNPSPMTTPIHFAIMRQLEMGPGDEWIAPWSKVTEIEANQALSELEFAMQFYREKRLLGLADP